MTYTVISIFKNESHIMNEWIEHYIREGCSEIILINNDSDDDWESKVSGKYDCVKVVNCPGKGQQRPAYNKFYPLSTSKWILFCDLDEFLFSRLKFKTVKDYLDSIDDESISAIQIPWTNFGSNGHKKQPDSVVNSFTKRVSYDVGSCPQVKTIIRKDRILYADVHWHFFNQGILVNPKFERIHNVHSWNMNVTDEKLKDFPLKINHYITQSEDYYWNTKAARGSVTDEEHKFPKNQKFFDKYNNVKNVLDDELYKKWI